MSEDGIITTSNGSHQFEFDDGDAYRPHGTAKLVMKKRAGDDTYQYDGHVTAERLVELLRVRDHDYWTRVPRGTRTGRMSLRNPPVASSPSTLYPQSGAELGNFNASLDAFEARNEDDVHWALRARIPLGRSIYVHDHDSTCTDLDEAMLFPQRRAARDYLSAGHHNAMAYEPLAVALVEEGYNSDKRTRVAMPWYGKELPLVLFALMHPRRSDKGYNTYVEKNSTKVQLSKELSRAELFHSTQEAMSFRNDPDCGLGVSTRAALEVQAVELVRKRNLDVEKFDRRTVSNRYIPWYHSAGPHVAYKLKGTMRGHEYVQEDGSTGPDADNAKLFPDTAAAEDHFREHFSTHVFYQPQPVELVRVPGGRADEFQHHELAKV